MTAPGEPRVRVAVLGPLAVTRDGAAVAAGSPQQQALLAALVLREGAQAGLDELVDGLWGAEPPPAARGTVRTYLSRLRALLAVPGGAAPIATVAGGYLLGRGSHTLDLAEHRELTAAAAAHLAADDPAAAAGRLHGALALWRGTPLAGLPGPYAEAQRRRLTELRTSALEQRLGVDVVLGRYTEVLGDLAVLVADDPLRERWRELELRALWGLGRQADALAAYHRARRTLGSELGIEPGPSLRALHERILAGEPPPAPRPAAAPVHAVPRPDQLPAVPAGFVARPHDTARLEEARAGGAAVVTIGGMAGVGKTTTALDWARRVAADYPDGRLHLDLRGFDPSVSPLAPGEALQALLTSLGVPPGEVPRGVGERSALLRTLCRGRRLLLLLDDAADEEQVRPLLPGSPGCLVLVTSRSSLAGLVATDGARPVGLDVLSPAESAEFLAVRLGAGRVAAAPAAVDRLARGAAGLPLALAVVAARAAVNPRFSLEDLAEEMAAARGLDAFASPDPASDLRAVFTCSFRELSDDAARLLRALAAHPATDVGVPAAAAAAGLPPAAARPALRELGAMSLVTELRPGRFGLHDLVRAFAAEQTPAGEREAVLRRVLDHYGHSAYGAVALLLPRRGPLEPEPPVPGAAPERFGDATAVMRWYETERHLFQPVLEAGHQLGLDRAVLRLAWSLQAPQHLRGRWHDWIASQELALRSAVRLGDDEWLAVVRHALAVGYHRVELPAVAERYADAAIAAFESLAQPRDPRLLGHAHVNRAVVAEDLGDPVLAARQRDLAVAHYRRVGDLGGEAGVWNNGGWISITVQDDPTTAAASFSRALELYRAAGDPLGEATATSNLALARGKLGDTAAAAAAYEAAAALFDAQAEVVEQAETLTALGDLHRRTGDDAAARHAWERALVVLSGTDGGTPVVSRLRARLGELLAGR
jgi:DNA-binding SARP family transcriptional activator/tetratricopeptide (TPR) repeat protein